MTRYRLYVGLIRGSASSRQTRPDFPVRAVVEAVAALFKGATVLPSYGLWEGRIEPSTVIEVLDLDGSITPESVHGRAVLLARQFEQDAILVTEERLDRAGFFGPKGQIKL